MKVITNYGGVTLVVTAIIFIKNTKIKHGFIARKGKYMFIRKGLKIFY